jgi:hypothetical protein
MLGVTSTRTLAQTTLQEASHSGYGQFLPQNPLSTNKAPPYRSNCAVRFAMGQSLPDIVTYR